MMPDDFYLYGEASLNVELPKPVYCPYCKREVEPLTVGNVQAEYYGEPIFLHDNVYHPNSFNIDDYKVKH